VAAHVGEDQLAVVVNVAAVAMSAAVVATNEVVVATNAAAVVGAEIGDRSRGPIQRTGKASFFMKCVCPKNRKAAIERRSQPFCVASLATRFGARSQEQEARS
jgi:hypothetical protein